LSRIISFCLFLLLPGQILLGQANNYRVKKYKLTTAPAILELARIVRAAGTDRFDLALQAAGLWAISAGLSYNLQNDHQMLETGFKVYDALYSWAKYVQDEKHTWNSA
jgi:hypothetical protein